MTHNLNCYIGIYDYVSFTNKTLWIQWQKQTNQMKSKKKTHITSVFTQSTKRYKWNVEFVAVLRFMNIQSARITKSNTVCFNELIYLYVVVKMKTISTTCQ